MTDLSRIRLIALDMGGVLLRNESRRELVRGRLDFRGREALAGFLADRGARATLEQLTTLLFDPWAAEYDRRHQSGEEARWEPHFERLREAVGTECTDLEMLEAWFRPYGEQLVEIDGARESLEQLRGADFELALISNVPLPGALYRSLLERDRMLEHLGEILFSYDFGSRKPSPAMLRRAMESAGVGPDETLMVGDRPLLDVACGLSAGARTVWVESDFRKGPASDAVIGSIADLPSLLVGQPA